jgi:hypothetical protein
VGIFMRHGLNLTGKLDCPCALGTDTPAPGVRARFFGR